jgi:hypothetical protein
MDENLLPFTIFSFFFFSFSLSTLCVCVSLSLGNSLCVYVRESEKGGRGEKKEKKGERKKRESVREGEGERKEEKREGVLSTRGGEKMKEKNADREREGVGQVSPCGWLGEDEVIFS